MMKLVERIEAEEADRKLLLSECKNDDERIKLRQKFITLKVHGQDEVKKLLLKHRNEVKYLDEQANPQPEQQEDEEAAQGEEEQGEEEEAEAEDEDEDEQ